MGDFASGRPAEPLYKFAADFYRLRWWWQWFEVA